MVAYVEHEAFDWSKMLALGYYLGIRDFLLVDVSKIYRVAQKMYPYFQTISGKLLQI